MFGATQPIVDELKQLVTNDKLRAVGSVADFAGSKEDTRTVPALFVVNVEDKALVRKETSLCSGRDFEETFYVIYAISNSKSKRADDNNDELIAWRKKVRELLEQFTPEGNQEKLIYMSGQKMFYNDTTLWWQDKFTTRYNQ